LWYKNVKGDNRGRKRIQVTLSVIRYADDFVIIHESEEIIAKAKIIAKIWLSSIGLELKPSKTRMCHTLNEFNGEKPGFDFLGFHIRQFKSNANSIGFKTLTKPSKDAVQKHLAKLRENLKRLRGAPQEAVISKLNPIIKGWSRYFLTGVSRKTFERIDDLLHKKLWKWSQFRHAHKGDQWIKRKYFPHHGGDNWRFKTVDGHFLIKHQDHKIQRHTKVSGTKSPYDGNFVYWATRMGKHPLIQPRMAKLIKAQKGKCQKCGYYFQPGDILETHHLDGNHKNNEQSNLSLLHGYCHDKAHGKGVNENHQIIEEPDDLKGSSPVLKPSMNGDIHA
jgi:RNA-directed DNA polymerase